MAVEEVELWRVQLQHKLLQAQSLERDILVIEFKRLMTEAQELQQRITAAEAAQKGGEGK